MKTVIVGSGNVASVLGFKMLGAGHEILQVAGRNEEEAAALAMKLNCRYTSAFESVNQNADIYVLAVSDKALSQIGRELFLGKNLAVHTAGSVSKDVLMNMSNNYGVLYPLQSLRKEYMSIPEIPLLIDANTEDNLALIGNFARTISGDVRVVHDEERLKLHAGAIIVNNFPNYLYTLTEDFCKKENVDFRLLLPLIRETTNRLQYFSPSEMLTGPAARNDAETIKKHLELFEAYPGLKKIYRLITETIIADKEA
jgi:predicted short-subunit dehydrogenase-like oxidoreductase (DUF2520 family)